MSDIETLAKQAVKVSRKLPYWEPEDGSDAYGWTSLVGKHRDSGLLDISNFEAISEDMQKRFPDDTEIVRFGHWGVGWIDELMIRVYDARGEITPAFEAAAEWRGALEEYPVASDEDYSAKEYEATVENIQNEGGHLILYAAPENWAHEVFGWLWDNNPAAVENRDDQGGSPTEAEIADALRDLGWLDVEAYNP